MSKIDPTKEWWLILKEIFIVFMILVGIAGASLEDGDLSGIDPIVFTGADFAKDGVSGGAGWQAFVSQDAIGSWRSDISAFAYQGMMN